MKPKINDQSVISLVTHVQDYLKDHTEDMNLLHIALVSILVCSLVYFVFWSIFVLANDKERLGHLENAHKRMVKNVSALVRLFH
jgi:hypothetical protein